MLLPMEAELGCSLGDSARWFADEVPYSKGNDADTDVAVASNVASLGVGYGACYFLSDTETGRKTVHAVTDGQECR